MQPQPTQPAQGYRETAVELRLEAVSLPRLMALLVALEGSPYLVQIKRLQIKPRFDAPEQLEATLLVSTYEKESS
jgi:general secretion pathway protein M